MEDADLGEFFVPFDGFDAKERPQEIQNKVYKLCKTAVKKDVYTYKCFALLLMNMFGHLTVPIHFVEAFDLADIVIEVNYKQAKKRTDEDWKKVMEIARQIGKHRPMKALFDHHMNIAVDTLVALVLGELHIYVDELDKKRSETEQRMIEQLLLAMDISNMLYFESVERETAQKMLELSDWEDAEWELT
jgi:hypothetical protein